VVMAARRKTREMEVEMVSFMAVVFSLVLLCCEKCVLEGWAVLEECRYAWLMRE
jgi:hypothetical protein